MITAQLSWDAWKASCFRARQEQWAAEQNERLRKAGAALGPQGMGTRPRSRGARTLKTTNCGAVRGPVVNPLRYDTGPVVLVIPVSEVEAMPPDAGHLITDTVDRRARHCMRHGYRLFQQHSRRYEGFHA